MYLIDSHCHIHENTFPIEQSEVFSNINKNDIRKILCIGVDEENSNQAVKFARKNSDEALNIYAAIGIHPHEAKQFSDKSILFLSELSKDKQVVAIGEIGLDYHYTNSPKEIQKIVLEQQITLAQKLNLPISFHVREAYNDFWQIYDRCVKNNGPIRGVMHSFTDTTVNLKKALERGLYIGVTGISTFVKKDNEIEMFNSIPLDRILLETDSPFLSPLGKRGRPNQPGYVKIIADILAEKRQVQPEEIYSITSKNSEDLFII